jgi:serine/threonine-protein kinase
VTGTDPDLWRRLSPHLDHVLGLPREDRAAYLDGLRGGNEEIARELAALLAAHDAAGDERFLESGAPRPMLAALEPGQSLGAYVLERELGRGGMGSVWLARRTDGRFERVVAVKFPDPSLIGRGGEQRFRVEGGILGRLAHPHIAQLLDAGVTAGGQPYLVIEHVDGVPLDQYCVDRGLPVEARIRLFLDVLSAVSAAHAQLVVHRDLKPANVLVTGDGQVKLLDFGIAKLLEDPAIPAAKSQVTRVGGFAMTPEYAAPEQVSGDPVSTATDIYALGVMLYLLLSGRHPVTIPVHAPLDLVKAVLDAVPADMSAAVGAESPTLKARLKGDLDTIVRKAMSKEPADRYPSAASFADDLSRHLRHDPIAARPDSAVYRVRQFVRRHRAGVALGALASAAAVAGIVAIVHQAGVARQERDFALRQLARAEAVIDLDQFLLTEAAPMGRPLEVSELLGRAERVVRRQSAGGAVSRVNLLLSIGDQYDVLDEVDQARGVLELAYAEASETGDPTLRARSACTLAAAVARGGELARAGELVTEGLAWLPFERRYVLDRIKCLKAASSVARESNEGATAILRIQEARALLEKSPYRSEIQELSMLMDVAESYRAAGRQAEALPSFERAAALLTALGRGQTQKAGTLYNNWALSLDIAGRPRDAEAIYRRGIEISRSDEANEAVSPMLLLNYSRVLWRLGRLEEAARHAEEAYDRALESGFTVVVNQSVVIRARIYRDLGDLTRAEAILEDGERRWRQWLPAGSPAFASLVLQQGLTAQARGDTATALQLLDRAYATADDARRSGGGIDFTPVVLTRRAEVRNASGHPREAAADARLALDRIRTALPPGFLSTARAEAYLALGRALAAQGEGAEGNAALAEALRHLEGGLGRDHPRAVELRRQLGMPG